MGQMTMTEVGLVGRGKLGIEYAAELVVVVVPPAEHGDLYQRHATLLARAVGPFRFLKCQA